MPRKTVFAFALLALTACFLSYKLGSSPIVLARSGTAPQDAARPPLPAPPAEWVVHATATPPSGIAVATRAAGGAGVQHVVDCISVTLSGATNIGDQVTFQLLDGSGIQWMQWFLPVASSNGPPSQVSLCGLSVVGVANESMTLEFQTNLGYQSVEMIGHDAT